MLSARVGGGKLLIYRQLGFISAIASLLLHWSNMIITHEYSQVLFAARGEIPRPDIPCF